MVRDRELEKLWYFDTEEDFSGREIEVKRKVDLASYNDYETIAKSPDWIDWTDSESLEFDFLARRVLKVYADRFILQASEYGISRYESMLGIEPYKDESLPERRKRVYLLWNKKIIWTHRNLLRWMDVAVGKGKSEVKLHYDEYGIEFKIYVYKGVNTDRVWLMGELRKIIPANLWMRWTLTYLQDICYGLFEQHKLKTIIYPATAEDRVDKLGICYGIAANNIKIRTKDKPIEVWIYDEIQREVVGDGGEKLTYDK